MKNKLMYFPVLAFALLGIWIFSIGYFRDGTIRSPEGIMLGGIDMILFAFILFVAYLVIFENKEKK
jgi:hypothetical protein